MSGDVQIIDVPGQGEVEFPADMPDAEIQRVIKRNLLAPNKFSETPGGAALMTRGSMGIGKQGDTMGAIQAARKQGIYDAGAKVADVTGSPALGALGNTVADISSDPLTWVGGGLGQLAKPAIRKGGELLMQAALKPNKFARDSGDAVKAVKTLLEEGVNVSQGGVEKLTAKIDDLDSQLGALIQNSKAKLQNTDVLQSLQGIVNQYRAGTLGSKNLAKIQEVADEFLQHPFFKGGNEMSVQDAQLMKRQNYKELGDKAFGSGIRPQAERDALKGITHGLKEGIVKAEPAAEALNAEMSPLINARNLVQERSSAAANNHVFGPFTWLMHPSTAALWAAERSPLIGSILARTLYSGAAPAAPAVGAGMGALIGQQLQQ